MAWPHLSRRQATPSVICVVYGTTGELIKLAPVLTRLRERGHRYLSATTAQQVEQIPPLLEQLELPEPDLWLGRGAGGRDLRTNSDVPALACHSSSQASPGAAASSAVRFVTVRASRSSSSTATR